MRRVLAAPILGERGEISIILSARFNGAGELHVYGLGIPSHIQVDFETLAIGSQIDHTQTNQVAVQYVVYGIAFRQQVGQVDSIALMEREILDDVSTAAGLPLLS